MIKIAISGVSGKMGRLLLSRFQQEKEFNLVGGIDRVPHTDLARTFSHVSEMNPTPDILIDFSLPENTLEQLSFCTKKNIGTVIGTTGFSESQAEKIIEYSRSIPIIRSANFSIGINALIQLVQLAAKLLNGYDIEIIEKHHRQKKDAPSGTALTLGEMIGQVTGRNFSEHALFGRTGKENERKNEIGIHSIRGGTVVGQHQIVFLGNSEEIELIHHAQSREIFVEGAIRAAKFIYHKPPGLYTMEDVLKG